MNKQALYASIAMLPVLAYAPLTGAQPEQSSQPKQILPQKHDNPLKIGDTMPRFTIADPTGGQHDLAKLLEQGPVVLTFYRGSWCPYCATELGNLQERLDQINQTGATVLAISPEKPRNTEAMARQKDYGFHFGTDRDNTLAKRLALAFTLDSETIEKYKQYGINLPESNDIDTWELPIPATYVIDTNGTIKYAFVDEDYSKRADYDQVVMTLRKLAMDD